MSDRRFQGRKREAAASETIGSVMLISVVVLAIAIIGVALTSQPAPAKIPAVSAVISESGSTVQIYHDGGDPLQRSEIAIQVDGADKTSSFTNNSGSTGWTSWSVGQTLTYIATSGTPRAVQIVYHTGSGGSTVLAGTDFSMGNPRPTASPTPTPGPSTITATAGTGGTISPSGAVSVVYGASQGFTITPNTGYSLTDVKVDGVSQGAITSYTFTNVVSGHTIAATFTANTYSITASAGTGGTITPSGQVNVTYGGSQSFTIANATGYYISSVAIDGVSNGSITSYTFSNVQAAHTIAATFATNPVITATATTGGSITPSGAVSVSYNASQSFAVAANSGYYLANVSVDGVSQGAITSYTFTNVRTSHTIAAYFSQYVYNITSTAGTGGTISPSGVTNVTYGGSQAYTIANATGYSIAAVTVDGVSQGAISSYTFSNIVANHTISASFSPMTYGIAASAGTGGSITPSGTTYVTYGGSQAYTIANATGYYIAAVTVDGVSQGSINSYTFTNVKTTHTISATFTQLTYNILSSAGTGGTISPSGTTSVTYGGSQAYTITPTTPGYDISAVTVDSVSQGAITSYTFSNVVAAHSITATFVKWGAPTVSSITPPSGAHNTVVPITNLAGTNFHTGASVTFGTDTACSVSKMTLTSVSVVSSTQITGSLSIPNGQSRVSYYVCVANTDGQSGVSSLKIFTVS